MSVNTSLFDVNWNLIYITYLKHQLHNFMHQNLKVLTENTTTPRNKIIFSMATKFQHDKIFLDYL
jgi:hypothetical protein